MWQMWLWHDGDSEKYKVWWQKSSDKNYKRFFFLSNIHKSESILFLRIKVSAITNVNQDFSGWVISTLHYRECGLHFDKTVNEDPAKCLN